MEYSGGRVKNWFSPNHVPKASGGPGMYKNFHQFHSLFFASKEHDYKKKNSSCIRS